MRVATGKVIDRKVVVEGEPLVEGSTVTVFLPEPDEPIELTVGRSVALEAGGPRG